MVSTSPLTYALALLAKNTTAPLKSSGFPHLPAGILSKICLALVSFAIKASFISVDIYPGATALTLMPFPAHSLLSALVSCATPPFDAAYAGTVIPPWKVRREATFMILPLEPDVGAGLDKRYAPKSRHSVNTVVKLTCNTASQSSKGNWCAGCLFWMPAHVSRMCMSYPALTRSGMILDTED